MSSNEWITTPEAARILGENPRSVRLWAAKGLLPATRMPGGHYRYSREHIEDIARKRRAQSTGQSDDSE